MQSPLVRRKAHEKGTRSAAYDAANQERVRVLREQSQALVEANQSEVRRLTARGGVLLDAMSAGTPDYMKERERAQRQFRAPIARVEDFAGERLGKIAGRTGVRQVGVSAQYSSRFNDRVTGPFRIADTHAGTLAVEFGSIMHLTRARHADEPTSEKAFFVRTSVIKGEGTDNSEELGYVRIGRYFRRSSWDAGHTDLDEHAGSFVLGSMAVDEADFTNLVGMGPEAEATAPDMLRHLERAATAFAILSEYAANQAGTEVNPLDADAIFLAIDAIHRPSAKPL